MVSIIGMFMSETKTREGVSDKGKAWSFSKAVFLEDGASEPIEIEVPKGFECIVREPVTINIQIRKKGYDLSAILV